MNALLAMDDNTQKVLLALIAGVPAWISAVGYVILHHKISTPSGQPIGKLAEETHSIAHANAALLTRVNTTVNGDDEQAA